MLSPRRRKARSLYWPWLAEQMNARGWLDKELAEHTHFTKASVSRWRNGRSVPDAEARAALAEAFGVPVDTIQHPADTLRVGDRANLGKGPSEERAEGGKTSPDTPPVFDPGRTPEGDTMDDFGARAKAFVESLPPEVRPDALDALEDWRAEWRTRKRMHHGTAPPQPAARRAGQRKRR